MKRCFMFLFSVAVQAATMTSNSNYQASLDQDGLLTLSVYAPRFDEALGTLTNFRMDGNVAVVADLTIWTKNILGNLDALIGMSIKLKWPDNPVYSQVIIAGAPISVAGVSALTEYAFVGAIDGSVTVATGCGFAFLMCDALPDQGDYRFSMRLTPYKQVSLPHNYSLSGAVTANFTSTYEYDEPMIHNPEPGTWALVVIPIMLLAIKAQRKAK